MKATQYKEMLAKQIQLNDTIDLKWREYSFERALWVECAELMNHIGDWKWWKVETPDRYQIWLELVDIWHFGLSMILQHNDILEYEGECFPDPQDYGIEVYELIEILVEDAVVHKHFDTYIFLALCKRVGLERDMLYLLYFGKGVLNEFRQANGYKEGSYIKTWGKVEDNVVLIDLMLEDPDLETLYERLEERYPKT